MNHTSHQASYDGEFKFTHTLHCIFFVLLQIIRHFHITMRPMLTLRFIQTLFFALALLFAQQGGVLHALSHAFAEKTAQHNKQTPHSPACEQCTSYAQLGGALNSGYLTFELHSSLVQTLAQYYFSFLTRHTLTAIARGPPLLQS